MLPTLEVVLALLFVSASFVLGMLLGPNLKIAIVSDAHRRMSVLWAISLILAEVAILVATAWTVPTMMEGNFYGFSAMIFVMSTIANFRLRP